MHGQETLPFPAKKFLQLPEFGAGRAFVGSTMTAWIGVPPSISRGRRRRDHGLGVCTWPPDAPAEVFLLAIKLWSLGSSAWSVAGSARFASVK